MTLLNRILALIFGSGVEVTCKCGRKLQVCPDAAEVIKKHGCWRCQKKQREALNRKVGTED